MKFNLELPRPILAVLAVLGLLFALDLFALAAQNRMHQAMQELELERNRLAALAKLPELVLEMQSGMRGYVLTASTAALAQYRGASDRFPAAIRKAREQPGLDENLAALLDRSATLWERWLGTYLSPIVVKRNAGEGSRSSMNEIAAILRDGSGEAVGEQLRETLRSAIEVQQARLTTAGTRTEDESNRVIRWIRLRMFALVITVAALALVLGRTLIRLTGQTSSREAAERHARESSAAVKAMNDESPLGIFVTDAAGGGGHANAAFERIAGLSSGQLLSKGWPSALHPDDRDRVLAAWNAALAQHTVFASEHRFLHRNGNVVWVSMKTARMSDGDTLIGYVCAVEDVTERRNAEDALRRSEERMQIALDGAHLALFDWNLPSGEIVLSRQWGALIGGNREPAVTTARRLAEILHPEDRDSLREPLIASLKGKVPVLRVEFRIRSQGGQWVRLKAYGTVTERDAVGRAVQLAGTMAAA